MPTTGAERHCYFLQTRLSFVFPRAQNIVITVVLVVYTEAASQGGDAVF